MPTITCGCGARAKLKPQHIGKRLACPSCRTAFRLACGDGLAESARLDHALIIRKGPERVGEQVFLAGPAELEIGKLPDKPIHLGGALVSRAHARLEPNNAGWRIVDLGSRNGLFVNGSKTAACDLSPGDLIGIGEYQLELVCTDPAATTASRRTAANLAGQTTAPPAPRSPAESADHDDSDDMMYRLVEEANTAPEEPAAEEKVVEPGPVCPSCQRELRKGAKICVQCGIDLRTGRALLISQDSDLDAVYVAAESVIGLASWICPLGIYPIASEAYGKSKPWAIRAIAVFTVVVTVWFWAYEWSGSPRMRSLKNLMLWSGEGTPDAEDLAMMYTLTGWGDAAAFNEQYEALAGTVPDEELSLAAHKALSPEQQCTGTHRPSQLLTHALLHGGILHLVGNLLFLMVLGTRVNALIGNIAGAVVYPLLAIAGGLGHMWTTVSEAPRPMLGASGAIMGLAGMYIVLFPANKVHMAAWARWGLFAGFHLSLRLFAVRGFWVVAFYIAFDIAFTVLGVRDSTAHWAHLGGFMVGAGLAFVLLVSRLVNARGGDLISVVLGRHAWSLIGKPDAGRKAILGG